jgi:hypothetical protein
MAGDQVTLEIEDIVDGGVDREKTLGESGRREALHLAFALPDRLVRDFGPVILAPPSFVVGTQAHLVERRAIRGQRSGSRSLCGCPPGLAGPFGSGPGIFFRTAGGPIRNNK